MNLQLHRKQYREDGIFSDLSTTEGDPVGVTLEHAYAVVDGHSTGWLPKIPKGVFRCVRGLHRLHNMVEDFETFEVTGVEGHKNILFHWGNYNKDSEGCILVGKTVIRREDQTQMITASRDVFAKFMSLQEGVDEFTLTVT